MADQTESATIIVLKVTSTNRTKADKQAAGVPPYHLNEYKCGSITGFLIVKDHFDLKVMKNNMDLLLPMDRKLVAKYDDKKNYRAHLIFGRHWLTKDQLLLCKRTIRGRIILRSDDPIIKHLKDNIFILRKYSLQYDLTYYMVPIQLPYLLLLESVSKYFEYRLIFKGTQKRNERYLIQQMNLIKSNRANREKNIYKITTKNKSKIKSFRVVHHIYKLQKDLHSLIQRKADDKVDYNVLKDGEIRFILGYMQQFDIDKYEILGAKPLNLSWQKYKNDFFKRNLHLKSLQLLREQYKPTLDKQSS